ncbi:hypothetical protein ADK87_02295 [Streptomyces sp. NRRL F-4711]|nr:hypothetical protein ADK87_02295 [Streptomyces sp. NRRL F-4711]
MTRTSTARPAARALIPVLAFTGIVVSVMQTMIMPMIKDLSQLPVLRQRFPIWLGQRRRRGV